MNFGSLIPWKDNTQVSPPRGDFEPFATFHREIDRLFDEMFSDRVGTGMRPFSRSGTVIPTVDVTEHDDEIVVTAELPGLDEKDIDVTLSGDILTIKGEKKSQDEGDRDGVHYSERRYGSFSRSLRLPFEATDAEVNARYDKGVLTIQVPKSPEQKESVRRIEVKAA